MKKIIAVLFAFCLTTSVAMAQEIILYPKDANLTYATNVIIEPDAAPFNLGGWKYDNVVVFPVKNIEEGIYAITLTYSRMADISFPMRVVAIKSLNDDEIDASQAHFDFLLEDTNPVSWSSYITKTVGGFSLPQGNFHIVLVPNTETPQFGDYVMNLREMRLKKIQ